MSDASISDIIAARRAAAEQHKQVVVQRLKELRDRTTDKNDEVTPATSQPNEELSENNPNPRENSEP